MKRVTRIGGIFFKSENPKKLMDWYDKHLGFNMHESDEVAVVFKDKFRSESDKQEYAIWSPFSRDTKYFDPSKKDFMINFRVADLTKLVTLLEEEGVQVLGEIKNYKQGKFAWIMDIEGNKVELWEPSIEK